MKITSFAFILAILFYGCTSSPQRQKTTVTDLVYNTGETKDGQVDAWVDVIGDMPKGELKTQIKISNDDRKEITVQDIVVAGTNSIRTQPVTGSVAPFALAPGKDTILNLKFSPVNDLKLSKATGMTGALKPAYTVFVDYNEIGNHTLLGVPVEPKADKDKYATYLKNYKKPITAYSFDTKTGFNKRETNYLKRAVTLKQAPFVYLSEQEIAVAGLNFRMKTYIFHDTLYSDVVVLNHAEVPVKFIKDAFDIVATNQPDDTKTITEEKIAGNKQDPNMMEKGDRIFIRLKKHMDQATSNQKLTFKLRGSFVLSGPKDLFIEDAELVPTQY